MRGAAAAGILAGEATVAYLSLRGASVAKLMPWAPQVVKDLNVGIVALIVNIVVLGVVAAITPAPRAPAPAVGAKP